MNAANRTVEADIMHLLACFVACFLSCFRVAISCFGSVCVCKLLGLFKQCVTVLQKVSFVQIF